MKGKILRKKEIERKLSDISDSVEIVEENIPPDFSVFSTLGLKKDGIYKKIEFAIESMIDILNIINSDLRFGTPENEEDIIKNMDKNKVFDKKILDVVNKMKGFRNILVHRYGEISDEQAYESIKEGIGDFENFVKEVEVFLRNNDKEN